MDSVTVRHLANLKRQVEASAKELVRSLQQEPILQLKYRGVPYSNE